MRDAKAARALRSGLRKTAVSWVVALAALAGTAVPAHGAPTPNPNPVSFNPQRATTSSAQRTVVVTNNDMVAFTITEIAITGPNAASFSVAPGGTCQAGIVLQPAGTPGNICSINVVFIPDSAGAKTATLELREVDMDPVTVPVALQGTGTGPAAAAPSPVTFPATQTTTVSAPQTITVQRNGNTISNIRIEAGGDAATFAISGGTCGGASGGPTCTIQVTFSPLQARTHSGALLFDDGPGTSGRVPLSGEGIEPVATVSPAAVQFVAQVGTTSPVQTATLRNDGRAPLTASAITIFGPDSDRFARSGGTCMNTTTLQPGQSCTVGVTFTPTEARAHSATLQFTDNSRSVVRSTQDVALSGIGSTEPPPDGDGDGVADGNDRCPLTKGVVPDGCPGPDADRDGVSNRADKCPRSPGDQSNGCPSRLNADIRGVWRVNRLLTKMMLLSVTTPVGSRITISCRAERKRVCPFKTRTIALTKRRTTGLTGYFRRPRILPAATVITVRVTKSRRVGSYERMVTRTGLRLPKVTQRCISTGGKTVRC